MKNGDIITTFLTNSDDLRKLENAVVDETKRETYVNSLNKLDELCKGNIDADDVNEKYEWHGVSITTDDLTLEGKSVKEFADVISNFDTFGITGNTNGDVDITMIMDNIYKGNPD